MNYLRNTMLHLLLLIAINLPYCDCGGSQVQRIFIIDSEQYTGKTTAITKPIKDAIRSYTDDVILQDITTIATPISRKNFDLIIYIGSGYVPAIADGVLAFRKKGGSVWFISEEPPFSGQAFASNADSNLFNPAVDTSHPNYPAYRLRTVLDGWTPESNPILKSSQWLESPPITVKGRNIFGETINPFVKACRQQSKLANWISSQGLPQLPNSCRFVPLVSVKYMDRNWVGKQIQMEGYPLCMIEHNCTSFGSSRSMFMSLGHSPLWPMIKRCLLPFSGGVSMNWCLRGFMWPLQSDRLRYGQNQSCELDVFAANYSNQTCKLKAQLSRYAKKVCGLEFPHRIINR